jgi:HEPN domain-containing protein
MDNIELHASIALSTPEIRQVTAAYERLFSALNLLDKLPASLLEVLDEEISKEYKDKRGPMADFMKCYRQYLKDEIAEAKVRDRKLRFGIGTARLDDYLLPSDCPHKDEGKD